MCNKINSDLKLIEKELRKVLNRQEENLHSTIRQNISLAKWLTGVGIGLLLLNIISAFSLSYKSLWFSLGSALFLWGLIRIIVVIITGKQKKQGELLQEISAKLGNEWKD